MMSSTSTLQLAQPSACQPVQLPHSERRWDLVNHSSFLCAIDNKRTSELVSFQTDNEIAPSPLPFDDESDSSLNYSQISESTTFSVSFSDYVPCSSGLRNDDINNVQNINQNALSPLKFASTAPTAVTVTRPTMEVSESLLAPNHSSVSDGSRSKLSFPITTNIHTESFNVILSEVFCELNGEYSDDWNDLDSMDIANYEHSPSVSNAQQSIATGHNGLGMHVNDQTGSNYDELPLEFISNIDIPSNQTPPLVHGCNGGGANLNIIGSAAHLESMMISQCHDLKEKGHRTEMCINIEDIFDYQTTIGFGSSCTVMKAQNIENGELVALKQLPKSQRNYGVKKSAKLVSNERAILDALAQHQNVVKLLAVYETPSHYFLATELLTGGTLLEKVLSSKADEMRAAGYVHDVLSAVSYMHSMNIVHNDLKLENIVLTKPGSGGVVKLIDFGSSQFVSPSRNYKSDIGTLHYIPPEITRALGDGRSGRELKKSDVWSIGVCCYVLVTGYIPFSGNTMEEVLENIKRHKKDGVRLPKNCKLKKNCIDFMKRLLCFDVETRLTADEALKHPFITGSVRAENSIDDSNSSDNMLEATPTPNLSSLYRSSGFYVDTELMSSIKD